MKKIFTLFLIGVGTVGFAQNKNVGIGTTRPDQSAILDLSSSTKGFLTPRMTQAQRDLILTPAQGLQVFQTDGQTGLYLFDGQQWVNSTAGVSANVSWGSGGNSASGSDFIGTTNDQSLKFKVNNVSSGSINRFGGANTYLGYESGKINTGQRNVGFGFGTLKTAANSTDNVAIGHSALSTLNNGTNNVAVGSGALEKTTIGSTNVGLGYKSMNSNLGGSNNLAMGSLSMEKNVSGNANIAVGNTSMQYKVSGNNNVAIGAAALEGNISGSGNLAIGYTAGRNETGSNKLYIANSSTTTPLIYGDFSAKFVSIGDVDVAKRSAAGTGGYNLLVKGGILTEKVKVALASSADWADYVFGDSYSLMPLNEVEEFTKTYKHLPNVPSAEEMVTNGLDVSQTSKLFMEKIEELTLYMIEMNKEIKSLKLENELLKNK